MYPIRRRQRRLPHSVGFGLLVVLGFAAWLGMGAGASSAQRSDESTPAGSQCLPAGLPQRPRWTGSGVFNGSDLILVDTVARDLLRYSLDNGRVRAEPPGPLTKNWSERYPSRIAAGDNRLVVQVEANRFVVMDPRYRFETSLDVRSKIGRDGSTIEKVYTWAPAGNDIVAFADVKTPGTGGGEQWSSGIVRFALSSQEAAPGFQFLSNLSVHDTSRKYHRMGYSYISSVGSTAYVILMDNGFRLFKNDKGSGLVEVTVGRKAGSPTAKRPLEKKPLEEFFPTWKNSPPLPSYVSAEDYMPLMEAVEGASMPTGLYSWQGSLYLVSRQPSTKSGGTQWLLSRIDPKKGEISLPVEIPSKSNHLFAVPGKNWVFVEKGPALGLREQDVRSILICQ